MKSLFEAEVVEIINIEEVEEGTFMSLNQWLDLIRHNCADEWGLQTHQDYSGEDDCESLQFQSRDDVDISPDDPLDDLVAEMERDQWYHWYQAQNLVWWQQEEDHEPICSPILMGSSVRGPKLYVQDLSDDEDYGIRWGCQSKNSKTRRKACWNPQFHQASPPPHRQAPHLSQLPDEWELWEEDVYDEEFHDARLLFEEFKQEQKQEGQVTFVLVSKGTEVPTSKEGNSLPFLPLFCQLVVNNELTVPEEGCQDNVTFVDVTLHPLSKAKSA